MVARISFLNAHRVRGARELDVLYFGRRLLGSGSPDGDVVNVSFNGAVYFRMLELGRKETCIQVEMVPDTENVLSIQAVSEGRVAGVTAQIIVKDEKGKRQYYVHLNTGETEEVKFVWNW